MKTYDLYHLEYDNDTQAMSALPRLHPRVRLAGGVVWPSLNHGIGEVSYLVLALPAGTQSEITRGLTPVATVSSDWAVEMIDAELERLDTLLEEEPEEEDELFEVNAEEEDDDE